jgi:hypothetical protein
MTDSSPDITNTPWQPVDYLPYLKELYELCAGFGEDLQRRAEKYHENWIPHLPQILDAIQSSCELLRHEIDHYGEWRDDGLQIDEVIQLITRIQ